MVSGKKTLHIRTKRRKLKDKYKVDKRRRDHSKSTNRLGKLLGDGKRRIVDPKIPNSWDGKAEMLRVHLDGLEASRVEKAKKKKEFVENFKKEAQLKALLGGDTELPDARVTVTGDTGSADTSQLAALNASLASASVVCLTADARDPSGTLPIDVIEYCQQLGKNVIVVLNLCDALPKKALTAWLQWFRSSPLLQTKGQSWWSCVPFTVKHPRASVDLLTSAITASAATEDPTARVAASALVVGLPRTGKAALVKACLMGRAANKHGLVRLSGRASLSTVPVRVSLVLPAGAARTSIRTRRVSPGVTFDWLCSLLAVDEVVASTAASSSSSSPPPLVASIFTALARYFGVAGELRDSDFQHVDAAMLAEMDVDTSGSGAKTLTRATAAPALISRVAAKRSLSPADAAAAIYAAWENVPVTGKRVAWWVAPPTAGRPVHLVPSAAEIEGAILDFCWGAPGTTLPSSTAPVRTAIFGSHQGQRDGSNASSSSSDDDGDTSMSSEE